MSPQKKAHGKGATVSCLIKFLHPSQQVSKPREWAEVGRVLDDLPGGQEDQLQRPTGNCRET